MDTVRAGNIGYHGYRRDTTPNLGRLADRSYVFKNAISVGGNTPVAMAGMMTGRWPYHRMSPGWTDKEWTGRTWFGMERFYSTDKEMGLPSALPTLAERLHRVGYTTAGFVTNIHLKKEFHFDRGFGEYVEYFPENGRVPYGHGEDVTDGAVRFVRSQQNSPFFLYVHYMDAHFPYRPPDPYRSRFLDPSVEVPDSVRFWRRWARTSGAEGKRMSPYAPALHDGAIAFVDHSIGELLRTIERSGYYENTMVVVTSDHGDEFLEHGWTL